MYTAKGIASGSVSDSREYFRYICMYIHTYICTVCSQASSPNFCRSKIVGARKSSYTCTLTHTHTYAHLSLAHSLTHTSSPCTDTAGATGEGAGPPPVKDGPGSRVVLAALAAIHQQNLFLELWQRAATFLFRLRICFYVSRH